MSQAAAQSPAMAMVKDLVEGVVPEMLREGVEPQPHAVFGLAGRTVVCNLPLDKRAWGPFLLAAAKTLDANAVALVFAAWVSQNTSTAPSRASDRRSAAWVALLDRANPRIQQMGWTYQLNPTVKPGQPGHIVGIQPADLPLDVQADSPHLQGLVKLWSSRTEHGG